MKAELLPTIIDAAKDAISMIDVEGNVSYMNGAAEEMFGYPRGELMGANLHRMLAPKEYHPAHFEAHKKFQETGEGAAIGATVELTALRKDGSEFPIALSLSSVRIGNGWHAVGVIRDISDRKVAEEEQRRYA